MQYESVLMVIGQYLSVDLHVKNGDKFISFMIKVISVNMV